jgi:UDP-N-acetylmuramate dehydrogenase
MGDERFWAALTAAFGDKPHRNELLANHTTSRLGGPAEMWLAVTTLSELVEAVNLAWQYRSPLFMLGGGANLLIRDGGMRGLVIENRANRVHFPAAGAPGETILLRVESGAIIPNLVRRCAKRGLSGLEWAVGIPGTIGGAVVNNAGAYGRDMAASLVRAELLSPEGKRVWQLVTWFEYGYRTSRLKQMPPETRGWVVLQAELQMMVASPADIEATMNEFNERRKSSQPPGATLGSMFKNPPGDYAGRLIEAVGLKGYQIGQAQISPVHANFFQNLGGATTTDMLALIETAQQRVAAKFGVQLELEIEVVGE